MLRQCDTHAAFDEAFGLAFVSLLQRQYPEITDFYLPPEGCSYRMAVVSIKKSYPGHARRIMFGIWSFLRQFMYTKFIVVVDEDIAIRDWADVIWAITTRMDPTRDPLLVDSTPIDYLDFASPVSGLGSKMGLDATNKWPGETSREWGRMIGADTRLRASMPKRCWPTSTAASRSMRVSAWRRTTVLRYCARPPFAMERLRKEGAALVYRCAKQRSEPTSDKRGAKADELALTPLELIARIYEVFPLLCPLCGGQMRLIAFITHSADIRQILDHIGVESEPPHISPARGPPLWDGSAPGTRRAPQITLRNTKPWW